MDLETLAKSKKAALTRNEVAELFGCDPRTVSQGIKDGTIPAIQLGRRVVIPRELLLAMLTTQKAS